MKKLLSVLLLLCMLVSLLPVAAMATSAEPSAAPAVESGVEGSAGESTEDAGETPPTNDPELGDPPADSAENNADESASTPNDDASYQDDDNTDADGSTAGDAAISTSGEAALPAVLSFGDGAPGDGEPPMHSHDFLDVSCNSFGSFSLTINGTDASGNHGSISIAAEDEVAITATPFEGYSKILYSCNASVPITVTESPANTFSFTVPAGAGSIMFDLTFAPTDALTLTYHYTYDDGSEGVFDVPFKSGAPVFLEVPDPLTERAITGFAVGSKTGSVLPANTYQLFTESTHLYAVYTESVKLSFHYSDSHTMDHYAAPNADFFMYPGGPIDGKVIVAWSTEKDGSGQRYEVDGVYRFDKNMDFYPVYAQDVVTITYHYGDKSSDPEYVAKGSFADVWPLDAFADFGLGSSATLKYWAIGSATGPQKFLPGQEMRANENIDLYAVLADETVTLTYNSGDGLNRTYTETVAKSSEVLLPDYPHFETPLGQVFFGWSLTANGDLLGSPAQFSEDTTLYAVWGTNILVTYDANGGTGSFKHTQSAGSTLSPVTAEDGLISREGYALTGWSTTADGSTPYDFTKPAETSITLYAIWQANDSGTGDDPAGDDPAGDDPAGDDPAGDKPTGDDPAGDKPTGDDPAGDKPTGDDPAGDKPTGDNPAGDKPAGDDPAGDEPAGDEAESSKSDNGMTNSSNPAPKHSPKTGDEALPMLWLALMGVSVLAVGVLLAKKKYFEK